MYGKIIIVFIALAVLNTVSSKTTHKIPTALFEARQKLVRCFTQVILEDDSDPSCKTKDDFKTLAEQYALVEEKYNNRTLHLNEKEIDLMLFTLNHPYMKDYLHHYNCANITSCLLKVLGQPVDLDKNATQTIGPKKQNMLKILFDPEEEPIYNDMSCHKAKELKECIIRESLTTCDNNTKTFFLDSYDYNLDKCKGVKVFTLNRPGDGAAGLMSTTFLTTVTLTLIYFFR